VTIVELPGEARIRAILLRTIRAKLTTLLPQHFTLEERGEIKPGYALILLSVPGRHYLVPETLNHRYAEPCQVYQTVDLAALFDADGAKAAGCVVAEKLAEYVRQVGEVLPPAIPPRASPRPGKSHQR
jgi:hypothetical protein